MDRPKSGTRQNPSRNEAETPKKRVFIVDDHPVYCDGLRRLVENEPGLAVCGCARSATEAFDKICQMNPDLVITDLNLPGKSGLELMQDIRPLMPEVPFLVVSMHDEKAYQNASYAQAVVVM